jgi:hypothetical protein
VHRQDRFRPRRQRRRRGGGIEVEGVEVDVREHRRCPGVHDDVRRCTERHRRRHHLIAGTDAGRQQRQVQRRRAGVDGYGVMRAGVLLERPLESRHARTGGQPPGLERLDDFGDLGQPDRRRCERHGEIGHGRMDRRLARHGPAGVRQRAYHAAED